MRNLLRPSFFIYSSLVVLSLVFGWFSIRQIKRQGIASIERLKVTTDQWRHCSLSSQRSLIGDATAKEIELRPPSLPSPSRPRSHGRRPRLFVESQRPAVPAPIRTRLSLATTRRRCANG